MKMPEHTDTPKEKILVYIRAEKQKTLHRRQVCINDIASVYCKYSRYEGQIKGMIVDKIRGKKSVISVMKIIEQITEIYDDAQVISIGEPEPDWQTMLAGGRKAVEYLSLQKNGYPEKARTTFFALTPDYLSDVRYCRCRLYKPFLISDSHSLIKEVIQPYF